MARGKFRGRGPTRRGTDEEDGGDAWLTTYADAVTLLMAFFVLLYAMSSVDVIKFQAFLQGLADPFGNEAGQGLLPADTGLQPELASVVPPAEAAQGEQMEPTLDPIDEVGDPLAEVAASSEGADPGEAGQEATDDQLEEVRAALDAALEAADLAPFVEQRREERGLVVSVASDDVLFELGSTRIGPLGRQVIRVVSETLDGFPNPLLVEGHTDDVPLERPGYTNWNLSTDRAVAVLSRMIDRHGLAPEDVGAVGYGEHHPLADNGTASGRARNRRVDIVVLVSEENDS
jgi:chemotaxis protein MotB